MITVESSMDGILVSKISKTFRVKPGVNNESGLTINLALCAGPCNLKVAAKI
jgi:hypothetical protein